ncbi:hypothetical protein B0H17DRAFT_1148941 [Mycena rosella]|uniref:Uncharacterized protein n=1 Tax=Mycena rosella TaxID=1033263 RepID=A0AAD7C6S6_MYCRO|nr:hypothetical protein B0H17DRAFT_1148941 [Mycena rosella]
MKMVFAFTSLQRAFLELEAVYDYTTVYRPRMNNYMAEPAPDTPVTQCVGCFTSVPLVAQHMWATHLPFWLLRPTHVFDAENILNMVPLRPPRNMTLHALGEELGEAAPPVLYSGNSTDQKIAAIICAAAQNPCNSLAVVRSNNQQSPARLNQQQRQQAKPYPATAPAKSKGAGAAAPKVVRDKFQTLVIPEMLPSIVAWADALAQVDQLITPYTSDPADRRYVLPEPALLVNTIPEQWRLWLHHWTMLAHGFIYSLSQPEHLQLLSAQEWRDVLAGLMKQLPKSIFVSSMLLWTNGRPMLVGVPLELSQCGWASTKIEERQRYVGRTATLMLNWTTKSTCPDIVSCVARQGGSNWLPADIQALKSAVCRYYTRAFWEYFGRAAVVPLRLDHDLEKEHGE